MGQWQPPVPAQRTYVVGDVHGCADQLSALLREIDGDSEDAGTDPVTLVFVGDYVDRGPDSAVVLRFLHDLSRTYPEHVVCLRGNHEEMLLAFLADPIGRGPDWLRYGAVETLQSFGITPPAVPPEEVTRAQLIDLAGALRVAMGGLLITWLRALPVSWNSGNLWVVHAGADPFEPMERQTEQALLWGHKDFNRVDRSDDQWVVVGHKVVDVAHSKRGRVYVDTGAATGGTLTAARFCSAGELSFLQARPPRRTADRTLPQAVGEA